MSHTGTILRDLHNVVEVCLQRNGRICAHCGQRYAAHSLSGIRCEGQDRGYELPAAKAEMELQSKNATEGEIALCAQNKSPRISDH